MSALTVSFHISLYDFQELEETINALQEQVELIQTRAAILQGELDSREGLPSSLSEEGPQISPSS